MKVTKIVSTETTYTLTTEEIEGIILEHLNLQHLGATDVMWDESSYGGVRGCMVTVVEDEEVCDNEPTTI